MPASNEVFLFSSTIAVATILNVGALFVLYVRRPLSVMDTLLLHNFTTSMTYGILRFVSIITSASSRLRHVVNEPFLEASTWLVGSIQLMMLVLIACQRFVAVYFPFKVKVWWTKSRTYKSILASYLIVLIGAGFVVVANLKMAFVTIGRTVYVMAAVKVSLSAVLFGVYFVIFLKLFLLKSPVSTSSRESPRRKIKSCVFSLAITCSNLIAFLPVVLHVFAHGAISIPISVMVLAWMDLIFNPISYIILKMGKRISELARFTCCLRLKGTKESDHFHTVMLFKKKRNSKPDSMDGIRITGSDNEAVREKVV